MSTADLAALVTELEDVHLDVEGASPEALVEGLARRQGILDRIQEADASALGPDSRRALRERLETVRSRDALVLAAVLQQHAEIAEALGESGRARVAARGYRATVDQPEMGTRRTA